mgnify:CR=1 FL=1
MTAGATATKFVEYAIEEKDEHCTDCHSPVPLANPSSGPWVKKHDLRELLVSVQESGRFRFVTLTVVLSDSHPTSCGENPAGPVRVVAHCFSSGSSHSARVPCSVGTTHRYSDLLDASTLLFLKKGSSPAREMLLARRALVGTFSRV